MLSKVADPSHCPVEVLDIHLPEVVLAEFPWQALEADEGLLVLRPHRGDEREEGGLLSRVPLEAQASTTSFRKSSTRLGRPIPRFTRSCVVLPSTAPSARRGRW